MEFPAELREEVAKLSLSMDDSSPQGSKSVAAPRIQSSNRHSSEERARNEASDPPGAMMKGKGKGLRKGGGEKSGSSPSEDKHHHY